MSEKLLSCRRCPRLAAHLDEVRQKHPDYHALPVEPFGSETPDLLIVGLAPGLHGANATGRPFTGDFAGVLLYETLHEFGFSNQPTATQRDDGLTLHRCRITNAVKCLPPENKPIGVEVNNCNTWLVEELNQLSKGAVILALGGISHKAVIKALALKQKDYPFAHSALHELPAQKSLLDSYHCSRYNTQTKRLTTEMFREVIGTAKRLIDT